MTVTAEHRHPEVRLVDMGDSSLDFERVVWVGKEAISSPARVKAAGKWRIHDELLTAGLEIPFSQRDLHLRSGALTVRLESDAMAKVEARPGA